MIKKFEDFNYYELLRISYNASSFEVRQAYKHMLAIYEENSLATYSLFTEDERKLILSKIEDAFMILIDDEKRKAYDNDLVNAGEAPDNLLTAREKKKAIPIYQTSKARANNNSLARIKKKIREKEAGDLTATMLRGDQISGKDLKNVRESLGIELEEIFQVTKISPTALAAIEKDDVANLPPKIYLISFLKAYAEALQLDPRQIVEGYIKNIS
ncbi:MAG: helix-turn-helix domain-containing protein [Deltaproteobacteria bacterium]|jgi:DnaJ-class molecular chaperone|nr:helix-turn-helix domain-containing protein [Deltaproteobacteria bacterium]